MIKFDHQDVLDYIINNIKLYNIDYRSSRELVLILGRIPGVSQIGSLDSIIRVTVRNYQVEITYANEYGHDYHVYKDLTFFNFLKLYLL